MIACANQKGGVGKTTTAVHLAVALRRAGRRVRLIDLDPQRNAVLSLCEEEQDAAPEGAGWWVWSACREVELWSPAKRDAELPASPDFDYVILDCPPNLDGGTQRALEASDHVLVPLQCEFLAMEGLTQILGRVQNTKPKGDVLRHVHVLPVMLEPASTLHQDILEDVWKHLSDRICDTWIPRDPGFSEASSFGRSLFSQNIKSIGARAYAKLAREVEDGWT
ncbi:MAG: ParA family protein [Planctomycetes bacterium]|nr:ParA family protein [Planctomycetota bacterium]MCB9891303.1 ParA family protein [Planctomycetota bacterium]MCB9919438.1 ParA family protein [Planctomycetota bacterium]